MQFRSFISFHQEACMSSEEKIRLSLDLTKEKNEILEQIAEEGLQKTEVVRKAITVVKVIHEERKKD